MTDTGATAAPDAEAAPSAAATPGQAAHAAWCKLRFPELKRDPAVPWQEFTDTQRAAWDAAAEAAIGIAGPPEVRRDACSAHDGDDHVQVRTYGNWMCVLSLRGLDDGWAALEAEAEELRGAKAPERLAKANTALKAEVARLRELLDNAGLTEVADEDAAWRKEQGL